MTNTFLDMLWPEKPDGYLSTWMKESNGIRFFHASQFSEAHEYMTAMAEHDDVYYTVGLLGHPPRSGRGGAKDVSFLPCMHADFDLLGDENVHAEENLPKTIEELSEFLGSANIPAPTRMVNSGNGIHAYWHFETPLVLDDAVARVRAAKALSEFQDTIIRLGKEHRGWKFDKTGDLARVLRYPGTKNHKTNPPKPVEIIR